jgi:hypothetical protein
MPQDSFIPHASFSPVEHQALHQIVSDANIYADEHVDACVDLASRAVVFTDEEENTSSFDVHGVIPVDGITDETTYIFVFITEDTHKVFAGCGPSLVALLGNL